jgi:anti-anti-sigma factor
MSDHFEIKPNAGSPESGVIVNFFKNVDTDLARDLYLSITELLENGCRDFVFDLCKMGYCNSKTLAAWVMVNKAMDEGQGHARFRVSRDSDIHRLITQSRLDDVFTIDLI